MKRTGFWLLLAVFAAATTWWMFWLPYREDRLFSVVPGGALFVSRHDRLAGRWSDVAASPAGDALARAGGLPRETVNALLGGAGARRLVRIVGSRPVVCAYMPARVTGDAPVWVVAGWVGSRAHLVRWGWLPRFVPGAEAVRMSHGRRFWRLPAAGLPGDWTACAAVAEGVLMVCLSPDPSSIRRFVGRAMVIAPPAPPLLVPVDGEGGPDRLWLRGEHGAYVPCELRRVDAGGIEGCLRLPSAGRPETGRWPDWDPERAAPLLARLRARPDAAAAAAFGYARRLCSLGATNSLAERIAAGFEQLADPSSPVAAFVFGGKRSGRLMGLRVPALIVAARAAGDGEADLSSRASEALDGFNRGGGGGWIPVTQSVGGRDIVIVESTRAGFYAALAPGERAALARLDDWVVLSSSVDVLREVLEPEPDAGGQGGEPSAHLARWWREFCTETDTAVHASLRLYADVPAAAKGLRNLLAVTSMALAVGGTDQSGARRGNLQAWQDALEWAGLVDRLSLDVADDGRETELRFRLKKVERE